VAAESCLHRGRPVPVRLQETAIVVPCFNEENRLDREQLAELARAPDLSVVFVNDGSSDGTQAVLEALRDASGGRIEALALERNVGKGEAVRHGMRFAIENGARVVGFADADLSTPPDELVRVRDELVRHGVSVVTGARVALIGRDIKRRASRHYLGRIFATFASAILETPFYDTQCGAKFFRASPLLAAALEAPFLSRWAFDVELLGRLLVGTKEHAPLTRRDFREVPLHRWEDVGGSKLRPGGMARAAGDLLVIARELRDLRRARR